MYYNNIEGVIVSILIYNITNIHLSLSPHNDEKRVGTETGVPTRFQAYIYIVKNHINKLICH